MTQRKPPVARFTRRSLVVLVAAALSGPAWAQASADGGPALAALRLPITFQRNDGQFPAEVIFASRGEQGLLTLRAGEIALSRNADAHPVRLRMKGANPAPEVETRQPLETRSHYYVAPQPVLDVPHYGELRMKDVYPGIDVALHGRDGSLEYDFVVAPGADPHDIRIDLAGADRASLDAQGNLVFERDGEVLEQRAPVAYQGEGASRRTVDAHFEITEGAEGPEARIAFGTYDAHEQLTIDPVLVYSTYVGGSGSGMKVKTDSSGRAYYAFRDAAAASSPEVINCLDVTRNTLVYQTHFGGTGTSTFANALALATDGSNTIYVAGNTAAPDFPVAHVPAGFSDAFVAAFDAQGHLAGGFTLGGGGRDAAEAVAIDPPGNIYIAGITDSTDFPGGPPLNGNGAGPNSDAFVAKYTKAFAPVYRRLLGGTGSEQAMGIDVTPFGEAVIVGQTSSGNFPTVNESAPPSPAPGIGPGAQRGFVAKLTADGLAWQYVQYIGGNSMSANAVAIDPLGSAVVVGNIDNANFLPSSPRAYAGGTDAFVVRLSPTGVPLSGTMLGGLGNDAANAVAIDAGGSVYVAGYTASADFPTVNPLAQGTSFRGVNDAFLTRLSGNMVDFSTYLGGTNPESAEGIAIGVDGGVYVSGMTLSPDFPVVGPLRNARVPTVDGFVSKIAGLAPSTTDARFTGISTRGIALGGEGVMIGGFIVGGGTPKTVVVRARGPSMGLAGALADPTLTLVPASGAASTFNDDWQTAANAADLSASGFAPGSPKEAAIMATLDPGAYTAIMSGAGGSGGLGIVEVYELDHPESPLTGISTRARVQTGDGVVIGGFAIQGTTPQTVIVRARGPSLAAQGVAGVLANPTLTLVRASDSSVVGFNDDWQSAPNAGEIAVTGLQPAAASESALYLTLEPGAYTAIVSGAGNTTGVAIVEVFIVR